ncbi:chloride channel protein [Lapidilactobacillus achengensis]|uniref:Chloride channel protein n=1 Tax=Lapidilactobacillus achengensis TaxID=2486000 RepID=A0ABW1UNT9_9LACO|nr:chloride channel protein [Lapidilactobacillus achengensis]
MTRWQGKIGLLGYGLFLSALIGVIGFIYIIVVEQLTALLWQHLPQQLGPRGGWVFLLVAVGTVLVGLGHRYWGPDLPLTAERALNTLRQTSRLAYSHVGRNLLMALVILIFGAGVGPEAGLLSTTVALSVWQADKLRYYFFRYPALHKLSLGQRWRCLLTPHRYLLPFDQATAAKLGQRQQKRFLIATFIMNGIVAFVVLMRAAGLPSFVVKMGPTNWQWSDFWLALPLMIFGGALGVGYRWLSRQFTQWFDFWQNRPIAKATIGGLAIFAIGVWAPHLLFSGQSALSLAPILGLKRSPGWLEVAVLLKLLLLLICLNTGWRGGDIFPIVFAAITQGFVLAQLLPRFDALFVVSVTAISLVVTVFQAPWLGGFFVALFFPWQLWPVLAVVSGVFWLVQRRLTHLTAKPA